MVALLWHSMQLDETFGTVPCMYVSRVVLARKDGAGAPKGCFGSVGHMVLMS
jgi:hypothetical protein